MLWARYAYTFFAWLFVLGVLTQALLAGAGLFKWFSIDLHRGLGYGVVLLPLVLSLLALPARLDRRTTLLTFLVVGMALIQPNLVYAKDTMPMIAALHPVNALLMFWIATVLGRRSLRLLRASRRAGRFSRLREHPTPVPSAESALPAVQPPRQ